MILFEIKCNQCNGRQSGQLYLRIKIINVSVTIIITLENRYNKSEMLEVYSCKKV